MPSSVIRTHWAYSDYDLKKLEDPWGARGGGDGVHSLARKGFARDNPQVGRWLKGFSMTEKQLTGLEARIQQAGKGKEQDAVRAWLREPPLAVSSGSSGALHRYGKDPANHVW